MKALIVLQLSALIFCSELSLLSQDLEFRFGELRNTDQFLCSQNAIEDFINECSAKGADNVAPSLRLQSAVRLSICEFQEANVAYPDVCADMTDDDDFRICVQEFRRSAQLWTTYSGHYRKLRSLCHEEAVPFFRRNLLDLFYNVTKVYTDFHSSTMDTSSQAYDLQCELLAKLQSMVDMMNQSYIRNQMERDAQEQAFNEFHKNMFERSQFVENAWDHVSSEITVNSAKVDGDLAKTHDKLQSVFEYIDTQLARISSANENLAAAHSEASLNISKDLASLWQNSRDGHFVLQNALEGNLHQSVKIDNLLQASHFQMQHIFNNVENESLAIIANVSRELREEALSVFVMFHTNFKSSFSHLKFLGDKVGQNVFNMNAVSSGLDSNLKTLQDKISELKQINVGSILNPFISNSKFAISLFLGLVGLQTFMKLKQEQGAFLGAILLGAITAFIAGSIFH
ncbi:hypothetical protein OXX80_004263 [Metschnikowia pulcherrima]